MAHIYDTTRLVHAEQAANLDWYEQEKEREAALARRVEYASVNRQTAESICDALAPDFGGNAAGDIVAELTDAYRKVIQIVSKFDNGEPKAGEFVPFQTKGNAAQLPHGADWVLSGMIKTRDARADKLEHTLENGSEVTDQQIERENAYIHFLNHQIEVQEAICEAAALAYEAETAMAYTRNNQRNKVASASRAEAQALLSKLRGKKLPANVTTLAQAQEQTETKEQSFMNLI